MKVESDPSPPARQPNWRGIAWYLLICFGMTWSIEITALLHGIRFARLSPGTVGLLAGIMFLPACSAFIVRRWITREGFADAGLRFGSWKPYPFVWLGIPCLLALVYGLTFLVGLGRFNAHPIRTLQVLYPLPAGKQLPPAPVLLTLFAFETVVTASLINVFATFGEEFGWTGYLLPGLLPLGRWKATILYGVIWGMWHAPLVVGGFNYPGHPVAGVIWMCAFTTAVGSVQCALLMRYRSVWLTSFLHANVNANAYGIWRLLATGVAIPWGGLLGLPGILVFGSVGIALMRRWDRT